MLFGLKITVSYSDSHFRSGALSYPSECVAYVWKGHMMIGAIAILVIMIAAVGTARISTLNIYSTEARDPRATANSKIPLRIRQAELVKQQATQSSKPSLRNGKPVRQQQAELEKQQASQRSKPSSKGRSRSKASKPSS